MGGVGAKEPVLMAGGVWKGFECGAKMGNRKGDARRNRVAGGRKAVEEKRDSAADKLKQMLR